MKRCLISKILAIACITTMIGVVPANATVSSLNNSNVSQASSVATENMAPTDVLNKVINYMDKNDWEGYYSLSEYLCNDGVLRNKDVQANHIGAADLKKIRLVKYKEIKPEDVSDIVDLSSYPSQYSNIHIYYIAADCLTYEENEYFHDGINYFVYVIGYNGNEYKLLQASQPIIKDDKNILFGDNEEKIQMFIQAELEKGNIIGSKGNLIRTNKATTEELMNDEGPLFEKYAPLRTPSYKYEYKGTKGLTIDQYLKTKAIGIKPLGLDDPINPNTYPYPSTIRIYLHNSGTITTLNFTTYLQNVVPNEWETYQQQPGSTTWYGTPTSAIQAGAVASKDFAWQRVYSHKYPNSGYDLQDSTVDQVYKAGTADSTCNAAISAVAGRAVVNSDNLLFPSWYIAGPYSSAGANLGTAYQNGAAYLANQSPYYDWFTILGWYYDYSPRSVNGKIKIFYY